MYPKYSSSVAVEPIADAATAPHAAQRLPKRRQKVQVRASGVHGKGVYATVAFEPGDRVIEYTGEVIPWADALARHPHNPDDPNHTFYFHIDDEHVIDGLLKGNAAKWINHGCTPNCESEVAGGRVFIRALTPIAPGDELFYDYRLFIDERYTPSLKRQFACRCGSAECRGTMLAPKRRRR